MQSKTADSHYTGHLARVNQSNKVITSENICNEQGAVVVAAGKEISPEVAKQIAKHKLVKPVECSISLENTLDGFAIVKTLQSMVEHPELVAALKDSNAIQFFTDECRWIGRYPLIQQKLTVLSSQLPFTYKKTLFGSIVAVLIANERKFEPERIHQIFVASLCRDLGYLHIDPTIIEKEEKLTVQEWRVLQGHVAIGYHFTTLVPNLPKLIPRMVLEHHETSDGFGYPRSKMAQDLHDDGQVVALSDLLVGIFYKHVMARDYNFRALEPILKVNEGVHGEANTMALINVMNRYFKPMEMRRNISDMPKLIESMIKRQPLLSSWYDIAEEFSQALNEIYSSTLLDRVNHMLERIHVMLVNSGASDEIQKSWLSSLQDQTISPEDGVELEKYELLLDEIIYQYGQLTRKFDEVMAEANLQPEQKDKLVKMIDLLDKLWKAASKGIT